MSQPATAPDAQWAGADPHTESPKPALGRPALAIVAVLGLLAAALAGFFLNRADGHPGNSSAEAGFARDMSTHHAQAVEMSFLIRDRTQDEDLRRMAFDIITSQQQQIGQMSAWLTLWGLPQTGTDPAMSWMGDMPGMDHGSMSHGEAMASMPGIASAEDMAKLTAARGVEAEKLFLQLMIAHHKGGVEMAKAALDRAKEPAVRNLSQGMVNAQSAEIETMTAMLAQRE